MQIWLFLCIGAPFKKGLGLLCKGLWGSYKASVFMNSGSSLWLSLE